MVGVIGLGFVGLTTALGLAEVGGNQVWGYEKDGSRRSAIAQGHVPFYEPGLPEALECHLGKNFRLAASMDDIVRNCKVIFYCVGTPAGEDGQADLSILNAAVRETLTLLKKRDYKVLVVKSTIPPSTTSVKVVELLNELGYRPGEDIGLANNPEFLREGKSWEDFTEPDRIVIGEFDRRSGEAVADFYKNFKAPIFRVSLNTGEFIKYLSNTLLATLISYSNEMSMIADVLGEIDVKKAFEILHLDGRWFGSPAKMTTYAYPGCGFGGYCLPKDTQALSEQARSSGFEPQILNQVLRTNEYVIRHILNKIEQLVPSRDTKIGILGLSFKPGSDDVRDTPAKKIIEGLLADGYYNILAHDPMAIAAFRNAYTLNIQYEKSTEQVIADSEVLVLVTAWDEYREVTQKIKSKPYFDARYFL
jgi:UDPglucose 6-dehydrogenase